MVSRKQPELRFSGFNGDWKLKKLNDLANISGGGTPSTKNSEYWNGDIDWYSPAELGDQIYLTGSRKKITKLGLKQSSAKIHPKGTVLFTSRAGIGNTAILAKEGATNQGFQSIIPMENTLDSYFIFSRTPELKRYGEVTGAGSTFVEISGKQMAEMPILVPDYKEQKKIGNFFKKIDKMIYMYQQELTTLKQTKQGFLQKMFPKEGEKVPEVRFPGFTDDWVQRKLGEVVNFFNGRAYKQQELLTSGKYRVLRVGNFNTNDRWYYSDLELEENKYADKGDLLYLWATNFGPEIWNEERVIYHYHIWKLDLLTSELDKQYLYTWLLTDKERIKQATNGTTMVHVTKGNMEQREFQYPSNINEQKKIGSFFKQLDETIALHQRELELLQLTKKAFLQKLFV